MLLWGKVFYIWSLLLTCAVLFRFHWVADDSDDSAVKQDSLPTIYVPIPSPAMHNSTAILKDFLFQNQRFYLLNVSSNFVHLLVPPHLQRATDQAVTHPYCEWIINAGPFHSDGSPAGGLILDGTAIVPPIPENDIGFGILKGGRRSDKSSTKRNYRDADAPKYVMGNFPLHHNYSSFSFWVSGFDWIIYQGTNVANTSRRPPFVERAPRTAVGIDAQGYLLALVADGCEKCPFTNYRGPTMIELANAFLKHGNVTYAVEMDGGSSSTLVHSAQLVNHPHCLDIVDHVCQRKVGSTLCWGTMPPKERV